MGQRSNLEIAHFLERYARLLSIEDERGFRARAMTRAAESIRAFPGNVAEEAAAGRLQEIDHVGSGIAAIVQDYLEKGSSPVVDETERRVPQESLALLSIPGLGPKTVRKLVIDLGITSPDRLKDAVEQGLITADSGFNARTQSAILSGLEWLAEHSGRTPLGTALPVARQLISDIETALQGSVTISLAGSLRRLEETAGDINLVATSSDIAELLSRCKSSIHHCSVPSW